MNDSLDPRLPRENLALPRFLAVIFFGFAALIGLSSIMALAIGITTRDWRTLGGGAGGGLAAWILRWLAIHLWSGRSIPRWFISAFGLVLVGLPLVAVMRGTWKEILGTIVVMIPVAMQFSATIRGYPGKPKPIDELA